MSPRLRSIVAVIAVVLVLSACTPGDPTPTATPSPEPTFQCTPIFSGDVYSCDQTEVDELAAERARYDEAAALYTKVLFETEALLAEKEPMSDELAASLTGDYLERTTATLVKYETSDTEVSGHRKVEWANPLIRVNKGSTLAIEVCSSPGDLVFETAGSRSRQFYTIEHVFFEDDYGNAPLRVASSKVAEVEEC